MKVMIKMQKKALLVILSVMATALFGLSCLFVSKPTVASAEEATFSMVKGASIYLQDEVAGIRFAASVPEADKDKGVSFLVVHKGMLAANDKMTGNKADIDITGDIVAQLCTNYAVEEEEFDSKFTVTDAKKASYYEAGEFPTAGYYVTGAIVGLPDTVYDEEFFSVAYYTGDTGRVYAAIGNADEVTRSISYVANAALANNYAKYLADGKVSTLVSYLESYGSDRYAYESADRNSLDYNQYYKTATSVEVVEYAGGSYTGVNGATCQSVHADDGKDYTVATPTTGEIVSPITENNKSLVKYTIDAVGDQSNIASVPMWYSSADNRTLSAEQRATIEQAQASGKRVYLGFYIYNATGAEETVMLINEKQNWDANTALRSTKVPSGEWTYVEFELTSDVLTSATDYKFGVMLNAWVSNATYKDVAFSGVNQSSQHIYYVDGMEVYTKPGDADDLELIGRALADNKTTKYPGSTAYEVVSYANVAAGKPEVSMGDYAVKGEITWTSSDLASIPVYYNNTGYTFTAPQGINYARMYLGVWVYSEDCNLTGYLTNGLNEGGGWGAYPANTKPTMQSVSAPQVRWTWMEFSLAHLNLDTATSYDFGIRLIGYVAPVAGTTLTYYVDGLRIFEKEPMEKATYGANYAREKNTDAAYDKDGDGVSYKYTFTQGFATNNNDGINNANRGRFFNYEAKVGEDLLFGLDDTTDWENLFCKVYIKQDAALASGHINMLLRIQTSTDGGKTFKGTSEMYFSGYHKNHDFANNTEWQEWEFSIADFISANAGLVDKWMSTEYGGEGVTHYRISLNTECTENVTFYIDGLSLYNK